MHDRYGCLLKRTSSRIIDATPRSGEIRLADDSSKKTLTTCLSVLRERNEDIKHDDGGGARQEMTTQATGAATDGVSLLVSSGMR